MKRWNGVKKGPRSPVPAVEFFFKEAERQRATLSDISDRAGVSLSTIRQMKNHCNPLYANLEACLNILGFTLKPSRIKHD